MADIVLDFVRMPFQVASCAGPSVTMWGLRSPRRAPRQYLAHVSGAVYFPSGDWLLTWGVSGRVLVLDARTGDRLGELQRAGALLQVRVLPAGDRVVGQLADGRTVVWGVPSGRVLRTVGAGSELMADPVLGVVGGVETFPAGGRVLAWALGRGAAVWDAVAGAQLCRLRPLHFDVAVARVFPRGDKVVTVGQDGRVDVWNASSCTRLGVSVATQRFSDVHVVLGGEAFAVLGHHSAPTVWNASTGEMLRSLSGWSLHMQRVLGSAAFPQGDVLAAFTDSKVVLWNVTSGEVVRQWSMRPRTIQGIAVSPDGGFLAACGGGRVAVWHLGSGARAYEFEEPPAAPRHG